MSFTFNDRFRPLRGLVHPALFYSSFRGGPSSKSSMPDSGGPPSPPAYPLHPDLSSSARFPARRSPENWKIERVVALVMLAIIPGSFVFDSPFMNYLLAASLALHAHWAMETFLTDYCPREALRFAHIIRYALTVLAFMGLCYFNYNDMGLTKALKSLWAMY